MIPVIYSDEFLEHKTGRFHPEKPERLSAITTALRHATFAEQIQWQIPTPIQSRQIIQIIHQVHSPQYLKHVQQLAQQGGGYLDPDTPVSPQSYDVALLAVSAWLDGVDQVLGTGNPAFVLARPPGHHAEPSAGMGFCLFSNAAIAANYALTQPGVTRVGILDWDVHHGNGTQAVVQNHPQIAYCSLHQSPCYPGTGAANERGAYNNVLNLPMALGSTGAEYKLVFEQQVLPFFDQLQPELLIVSAGYDANAADPLANMNLEPEDYGVLTQYCLGLTRRTVFGLEGGYDFSALSRSVLATIEQCLI